MADNYSTDLEYQEIRRRIERRLSRGRALLAHVIVYLLAVLVIVWNGLYQIPDYTTYPWAVNLPLTGAFALWSVLLAGHGFFTFRRSAAGGKLEPAIEAELRERLEEDDTTLMRDRRGALPLHHLLHGDLRRRAILIYTLLPYLVLNAGIWLSWVYDRATKTDSQFSVYPWFGPFQLPIIILPLLALCAILQQRHQRYVRRMLASWDLAAPKQKRRLPDYEEGYPPPLAEDGELVAWPEDNQAAELRNK